ncbi:MAG: Imidazole glycerol phosphate dehydratase [Aureobasidium pullulans]|nr:MAG: Imidazole glycerol phosphate dehydratase [Aureobasidium pullulans]
MNRAVAPVLATVCGVATAFAAFQPELQKQAAEREGKNVEQFQEQHGGAIPPTSHDPSIPDINNNKSIGAEVKQHLNEAKDEAMTEIQHIKNEAKTDVAPQKAWWGLGLFGASQGGSESPREGEKKP